VNTKILLLTPYSFKFHGGVQNQIKLMKYYLDSNPDYEVKLFAPDTEDYVFKNTFKIRFNNSISNVALFPDKNLLKIALDWADVIHIHEPFIPIVFWRLPKNKNYITTHHASISNIYLQIMKFIYFFRNINSVSTHVSPLALSNALTLNKNTTLIPNFIQINQSCSFNDSKSYLFIGRNEKRKNFKLFKALSTELVNDYNFLAITNKDTNCKNIEVYCNPTEEEKIKILRKSGIYLSLNKKSESFGITLIEAVNNGCLAIGSDIESTRFVLGDSGIYFKNNSLKSLVDVLSKLNTEDLNTLWRKQYNKLNQYDLVKNMKKYESIYKLF
jgi:glycosyltransferase involved in cell wall biosynthesis